MEKFIDFENNGYTRDHVPDHIRETLEKYLIYGWMPGGFLEAMLAGDLFRAASNADSTNGPALQGIARWISHSAPHGSWGSYEAVKDWSRDVDGIRTKFAEPLEKKYVWKTLKA